MASVVLEPEVVAHWSEGVAAAGPAGDATERFVRAVVDQLLPEPPAAGPPGPGRPRVLPALALWAGLLVGV